MKAVVEYLKDKNLLFKSFKEVSPKVLGSRKKVAIYVGVDMKGYYATVFVIQKKSRVLRKEVEAFLLLHERLERYIESKITKKYILIEAPLCSHAKAMLEEKQWKVWTI
jgi:hypothetical protein